MRTCYLSWNDWFRPLLDLTCDFAEENGKRKF
jgi:hypothetical protein